MTSRKRMFDARSLRRPAILALEARLIFDGAFVPTLDGIDEEPVKPVDPRRDARAVDEGTPKSETRIPRLRSSPIDINEPVDTQTDVSNKLPQGERVLVVSGYLP